MERKESNQMFVISNIKQWGKEMRVFTHCLCSPLKKTKDTQASPSSVHSRVIIDRDTPLALTLYAHQTLNGIKSISSNIKVYILYKIFAIHFINH